MDELEKVIMEQKTTPTKSPSNRASQITAKRTLVENPATGSQNLEDTQRIERIWAERAIQLAKVDAGAEDQGEQVTVVLVRLGRELLGLDVQYVFDIRAREAITRVPRVPTWIVGVTNLRGNILSVIDLCKYFGLPNDPTHNDREHSGLLVIVQTNANKQNSGMEIVFLVDDVLGVETIPVQQSAAASGMIHSLRPEYIEFIGERKWSAEAAAGDVLAQRHVVILNVESLLTDQRLIIYEEVA